MEESRKRPREEPGDQGANKAPKVEGEKKKLEVAINEWKAKVLQALEEGGWEGCKAILDEVVKKCEQQGLVEYDSPHIVHVLYGEIAETAPDQVIPNLVDYMHRPEVVSLSHKKRYIPFLNPILFATHNISTRASLDPSTTGKAQLLPSVLSCVRQDVSILPQKSNITPAELKRCSKEPEKGCLKEILSRLRKNHSIPVPDEDQFIKDIKELQTKSSTMINAMKEADAIHGFASEVESLVSRLLKAMGTVTKNCKDLTEAANKREGYGMLRTGPVVEGPWDIVKLNSDGYMMYLQMLMAVVVGYVMYRCLTELVGVRSAAGKKPFEVTAGRMKVVRGSILKGMGGSGVGEAVLKEFWRDCVWYNWKTMGCPRQAFEGAEAIASELQTRSFKDGKTKPKPFVHAERACSNTVPLPRPPRTHPKGFTTPKSMPYGTEPWIHHHAFTSSPLPGYLTETFPPLSGPAPTPPQYQGHPATTMTEIYFACRLLAAQDMKKVLDDSSYYFTDKETFEGVKN